MLRQWVIKEYRTRMFWLLIGLVASFLIAGLVDSFHEVLAENLVLAYFIPMIVYISDAVGTQMESLIIRAISQEKRFTLAGFATKQAAVTLLVGITLSILAGIAVHLLYSDIRLSITIGIGLFGGIVSSLVTGMVLPYYFWKFHQDPAEASGPVATVIQDFVSVFIFFLVAQMLL